MHRAHDIGGVGLDRARIGGAHQRLGRQVEDDLRANPPRLAASAARSRMSPIRCVDAARRRAAARTGWARSAAPAQSPHLGARARCSQSASQPPLKPVWPVTRTRRPRQKLGMSCSSPDLPRRLAAAHSSSRCCLSRSVSIGCQKPSWRKAISCPSRASVSSGSRSQTSSSPCM